MTIRIFSGTVRLGDQYRVGDGMPGAVYIHNKDVVDEIAEEKWGENVRVTLDGEVLANGSAVAELGWGYSEYTPIESDKLTVGDCDLLERLIALEDHFVRLEVTDELEAS